MNATATKRIALATLAAPVLAALAVGLAGTASADANPPPAGAASAGRNRVVSPAPGPKDTPRHRQHSSSAPLDKCSVIATRQDHRIARRKPRATSPPMSTSTARPPPKHRPTNTNG